MCMRPTWYVMSAPSTKMMSIGLHTRLVGRPGRAADLARFLDHVADSSDVWVARRVEIAQHWREKFPAPGAEGPAR